MFPKKGFYKSKGSMLIPVPAAQALKGGEKVIQSNSISSLFFKTNFSSSESIAKTSDSGQNSSKSFVDVLNEHLSASSRKSEQSGYKKAEDRYLSSSSRDSSSNSDTVTNERLKDSEAKEVSGRPTAKTAEKEKTDSHKVDDKDPSEDVKPKESSLSLDEILAVLEALAAMLEGQSLESASLTSVEGENGANPVGAFPESLQQLLGSADLKELKSLLESIKTSDASVFGEAGGSGVHDKLAALLEKLGITSESIALDKSGIAALSSEASAELIQKMKAVSAELADKITNTQGQVAQTEPGTVLASAAQVSEEGQEAAQTDKHANTADVAAEGESAGSVILDTVNAALAVDGEGDSTTGQGQQYGAQAGNANAPVKGVEASSGVKTEFKLPERPMAQSVANQVAMKVKLMAGENRQEMELQLKPESLGKLSLKIVHERGEILAKITAENEQVKGILESNLQLLKDALEKNGLSVQQLSVSVGNGSNSDSKQSKEDSRNSFYAEKSGETSAAGAVNPAELLEKIAKEYFGSQNTINLSA